MKKNIDTEAIYLSLPVPFQNLLVTLEGWRLKKRRYGNEYGKVCREVLERSLFNNEKLIQYQDKRLRVFLAIATKSPFWKSRFGEYGIRIDSDDIFSEIKKLPVLTKEEVKKHADEILDKSALQHESVSCHTSGTTGSGLVFKTTRRAEMEQWATWWRYRSWHNISFDTWCGYFGGRSIVPLKQKTPPFWRINRAGKQLMFSTYHLRAETSSYYFKALSEHKIEWLHGYPSVLALLASFFLELKMPPLSSLKIITTGAESLLLQQRQIIEKAFQVPVRQHYGQAEAVANISECEEGNFHVDEDFSLVEFIPVDADSKKYRIAGTNWTNPVFPLIRYDTGDIATLGDGRCSCGKAGRLVKAIDGRIEDYVTLPDGSKVGRMDHIFKDLIHIREAQIYQKEAGEIIFRVVKGDGYDECHEEQKLISEGRKRLGSDIKISLQYADKLPRTSSGKLRLVVSEISRIGSNIE